ncbi:MAG: hypothetical protein H0X25_05195 [Acidobacteriales bacterium]|nr:hypothetical protein [Terriglobales bacterium]
MKTGIRIFCFCVTLAAALAGADTVILRDGTSYDGKLAGAETLSFVDSQGIQYQIPRRDVQSLVFTPATDVVTLKNGTVHKGQLSGDRQLSFDGAEGIDYKFPVKDIASVTLTDATPAMGPTPQAGDKTVPAGTEVPVRTNEAIDSQNATPGQVYSAVITEDVFDVGGTVAIKKNSPAKLTIRNVTRGAVGSPEVVLDLYSVTVDGKEYHVVTADLDESNKHGLGRNRRTAEMLGGGAALGALVGGIFGGGRGAGIGAASGTGGGFLTQLLTRGHRVQVPAETTLRFRLVRTLLLRP